MKQKVYTSITLPEDLKIKLESCAHDLGVDTARLLSVLCYKVLKFVPKKARCLQAVEYQERGWNYEITPVCFFAEDHEFLHAQRYACKVSVSKLLVCAMVMFLDEIMEKGINEMEIAQLRVIQNSYKQKSYYIRNLTIKITKNNQFDDFIMKMRIRKT